MRGGHKQDERSLIDHQMPLPTHWQVAEGTQQSKAALTFPPPFVAPQFTSILRLGLSAVPSVRTIFSMVGSSSLPPLATRSIVRILIDHYPNKVNRADLAHWLGQSFSSSGYRNNLSALCGFGVAMYPDGASIRATALLFPKGSK